MSWWGIIKADKSYYDLLWDLEGRLNDGDAKRILASILAKGQKNDDLKIHVINPNEAFKSGGGFDVMGGVDENLLSGEELRELNRLARRVRMDADMSDVERERYEELLQQGGAVLAETGAETGEQSYDLPIMIGFNGLMFYLHVMEQNGIYDAFLSKSGEANNANFMESRQLVEQIHEMLEAIE